MFSWLLWTEIGNENLDNIFDWSVETLNKNAAPHLCPIFVTYKRIFLYPKMIFYLYQISLLCYNFCFVGTHDVNLFFVTPSDLQFFQFAFAELFQLFS